MRPACSCHRIYVNTVDLHVNVAELTINELPERYGYHANPCDLADSCKAMEQSVALSASAPGSLTLQLVNVPQ